MRTAPIYPSADAVNMAAPARISQAELAALIANHKEWVESNGTRGSRAFAGPLNLCGMDLRGADLQRADFTEVDLRCANLSGATLTGARGLAAERLGGANLTDVELSPSLSGFDTLQIAEELSKSSRALLLALLMVCAYCWLTIGTTLDVKLLANSVRSALPIIQTEVPISSFYWIVPVALLAASMYIHLHLLRFWQALAALPAFFPNGMRLEDRVYPWLLSGVAGRRLATGRRSRRRFAALETALAEFITWWFVPVTIAAFWLRYLSRHDAAGTALHVVILVVAITSSLVFRAAAYAEMERCASQTGTRWALATGLAAACAAAGFSSLVLTTPHFGIYGLSFFPELSGARLSGENLRGVDMTHARVNGAVLDGADLRDARLTGVPMQRANLKGAKLEEATLDKADLDNADLRDASLQGASLQGAVLKGVRLSAETNINGARLEGADLRNVTLLEVLFAGSHIDSKTQFDREGLRGANASGAIFHVMLFDGLDIRKANFRNAMLEGAIFRNVRAGSKTRFDNAVMRKSTFDCAPPTDAEIATKDVKNLPSSASVRRFKNSHFDFAKLQDSTFGPCLMSRTIFEGAFLQRSTFTGTILTESEFTRATLDNARFLGGTDVDGATFEGARLIGTDFSGAKNLTSDQLTDACGDSSTRLPEYLKTVSLKACSPNSDPR
jgi:uncharacterized protein YjbI with pentapeptide repeats